MRKSWRSLLALCFVSVASPLFGQNDLPVIRGTINVILANGNGIVALTDSQQTEVTPAGLRPHPQPGQKLFRLDDRTVCTIAGFASAPLPTLPEFTDSAAGAIKEYARRVSANRGLTFAQKLRGLSGVLAFFLTAVANVRDVAPEPGLYHLELITAGYDLDGTPKLGRVTLSVTVHRGVTGGLVFSPVTERLEDRTVRRDLTYEIGGQPGVALGILGNPQQVSDDPAIREYAAAFASDRGASLTIEQMKRLAIALARHTSVNNPTVGGADQIAILQNGRIASFQQQAFREQPPAVPLVIIVSNTMTGGTGIYYDGPTPTQLFIDDRFVRARQPLDGSFFTGNEFVDCQLRYDGGWTRFDSKNRTGGSVLIVGRRAARDSETVRHLVGDFAWKEVIFEKP